MTLPEIISQGQRVVAHRPWPRVIVSAPVWRDVTQHLAAGRAALLGLWGDADNNGNAPAVHMAITAEDDSGIAVITLPCPDRGFPSVGALHLPAIRFERAIMCLFGLAPIGAPDVRPWLDLGFWDVQHPLGDARRAPAQREPYAFLPAEGESLHQIPVGPVHAGIIEPGHFRFTAGGETVVRLEQRFGYVHKGIEALMAGAPIERGARLAARTSGDSTVAYGIAFAHAVEAAFSIEPPPRALYLRALMAELERLANHCGDIGAICNDASFALMHAHTGVLRELALRASEAAFGHRLMMDRVVPGGVACDLNAEGRKRITELVQQVRNRFPQLVELYDNTASLQDRTVATGIVRAELARQFAAPGYVGRGSGRAVDARRRPGYAPYDRLNFTVPVSSAGDVDARVRVRIREVEQSLTLIDQILVALPGGPTACAFPEHSGEGLGFAESFRGEVLAWMRIERGRIARCHLRDPSWLQWPLLEAAVEGNIVADFPLCNKSFNCSYAGHDL